MSSNVSAATWSITYPGPEFEGDTRVEYPTALIELAMKKAGVRYTIKPSDAYLLQNKAIKKLKESIEINIVWSMTDEQREAELLPIRIPITKGLIGWRVLLVNKNTAFNDAQITQFSDLLQFSPVQGIHWPDTKILQSNGFNVKTSQNVVDGYNMLFKKQADFFPRAVTEILEELDSLQQKDALRIKPGVILEYPTAMYFFVNKLDKTLARVIETGLRRSIKDGSFDQLFMQHFGETLQILDVKNALRFKIDNPLMPVNTPVFEPELWYRPQTN